MDLPQLPIESCDDCGVCCRVQGAPPDYVALSLNPHFANDPSFAEDVERLSTLSGEAKTLLDDYLEKSSHPDFNRNGPCVWLDGKLERCRFHQDRPSTCRVFEVGSPGCLIYRKQFGID